ncbi:MAG: FtsX-like permease family protein [Promethearchaeota archaeon]
MGVISKIAIRNMKRRKTRYILTTATLVIGVALFGGIMIASDSFYEMMLKSMDEQMGTADILIRNNNGGDGWFDPDDIDDILKDQENIEYISYRITGFDIYVSGALDDGNWENNATSSNIDGIDIDDDDEHELGGAPYVLDVVKEVKNANTVEELLDYESDETGDRVIVISESLKIKLGKDIQAGSVVKILPDNVPTNGTYKGYDKTDTGTWISYTISAIIRDSGELQDFDPSEDEEDGGGMSFGSGGYVVFTNIDNAHELADGTEDHKGEYNLGVVGVDDIHNTEAVTEAVEEEFKDQKDGDDWKVHDLKTDSLESIDNSMTTMRAMFMMFGLVALILSIVLIANIFNIIREEQEYETGMFQAIGASKSETFRLFITQGVVMGLIGSLIGTVLSYWISYWIFDTVVTTMEDIMESTSMGFTMTEFEIVLLPATLIATFSIGFFSCLIASISPSYKASKKPLIECLNPIAEKSEREKKKYGKKILFAIFGSALIIWSAVALFDSGGGMGGGNDDVAQSVIAMTAPTYMLLGIIIITALFVRPLSRGVMRFFGPYLKQTKLLTEKNLLRHRKRTVLTYSMIALTVSFLVGMTVSMDSMKEGINTTVDDFMGSDARVFAFGPRSLEDQLIKIDGVDDVMGIRYQNAEVKVGGEWVGHSQLEEDYDTSITVNIIDPDTVTEHMTETEIIAPTSASLEDLMDEINDGNNIIVTDEFANDYDVEVGDKITVRFSLETSYASLQAVFAGDDSDVKEITAELEMEIVGIVNKIQGFFTGGMGFGDSDVESYTMFISWDTFEAEIAPINLPGGGTDLIVREWDASLDVYQSKWLNFSNVEPILNTITSIDYYTTRMDYNTYTVNTNFNSPVVGIHTSSNGQILSDSYFGTNTLIEKNDTYTGSTMEELLDIDENVCVVDEMFVGLQQAAGDINFGIDSEVPIFPFDTNPVPVELSAGSVNTTIDIDEGIQIDGVIDNLLVSDDVNISFVSNNENLTVNINYTIATKYLQKFPTPISVNIEFAINATVDNLKLEVLNLNTGLFESLGDVNSTDNHTLPFNGLGSYVNLTSGLMEFRIFGQNSTADANFSLDIDTFSINITQSNLNISDPSAWPTFQVIGIINTPKLYNTERYFWPFGAEDLADVMGCAVYINYNKSRELIYPDYKGSVHSNDKVTSVLVHCSSIYEIESTKNALLGSLMVGLPDLYSIADIKTATLDMRTYGLDWYFWFEEGVDEEEVLQDIQQYLEDHGYIVMFGFTRTFMITTFISMINMMSLITSGMLLLAIIISLIGLALHSLLTTMSRRREIGMLRSIGLSKKGIVRSISGETLIISILGVMIGIFAGLIQGTLMVLATPEGGFITYTLVYPWFTIGVLILITITAAILSSRFPARWAANLNIIDAVRTR